VYLRALGRSGPLIRAAHRMGVTPRFAVLADADAEVARADLVVSTLPAHAADPLAAALSAALPGPPSDAGGAEGARDAHGFPGVLLDVVYEPRPTALARAWAAGGGVAVGGERMLLHQAVEQVRLMTGRPGPLAAMDSALSARLSA